jgi:hypothetical protein
MAYEVMTTPDKHKRDEIFQELKHSTITVKKLVKGEMREVVVPHPTESQAVRFSSVEMVTPPAIDNTTTPPTVRKAEYRSTWSVAYPTS